MVDGGPCHGHVGPAPGGTPLSPIAQFDGRTPGGRPFPGRTELDSIGRRVRARRDRRRFVRVEGVSFVLRYDPGYAGARSAIADGEIGEPVAARTMRAITTEESRRIGGRGHPLFHMNVHDVDAMRWCLGAEVERVNGVERRGELTDVDVPDAQQATLEFDSGAIGVLEGYGVLPDDTPGGIVADLDVIGDDGRASVDTPGTTLTVHGERFDRPDTRHWPVVNDRMDGCVRRQIDRFAEAVSGEDRLPPSMADGYRAQAVAAAVLEATDADEPRTVEY